MDVLEKKSFRTYDYISRYQSFPYYYNKEDDKYIYGVTSHIDDSSGYSIHIVRDGDTYDSISLQYYNNPTLYWIICDFNRVCDPYKKLNVGDRIKIPVISSLQFIQEN